jgi:hypothetical protein
MTEQITSTKDLRKSCTTKPESTHRPRRRLSPISETRESNQELSKACIDTFVEGIFGESAEAFLRHAGARTDGRFRKRRFETARAGEGVDQRLTVESSPVPLAVVNGGADRFVNLDYSIRSRMPICGKDAVIA